MHRRKTSILAFSLFAIFVLHGLVGETQTARDFKNDRLFHIARSSKHRLASTVTKQTSMMSFDIHRRRTFVRDDVTRPTTKRALFTGFVDDLFGAFQKNHCCAWTNCASVPTTAINETRPKKNQTEAVTFSLYVSGVFKAGLAPTRVIRKPSIRL